MNLLRSSLILVIAICIFLPLSQAEDNVYRVDGIPEDLHFETGKTYQVDLIANDDSEIASISISITNGSLSETEDFGEGVQSLELGSSDSGWTFYWQAPSESFELGEGEKTEVEVTPARHFDIGEGKGQKITKGVTGGVVGLVIDARGRPLDLGGSKGKEPIDKVLSKWNRAFDAYPT